MLRLRRCQRHLPHSRWLPPRARFASAVPPSVAEPPPIEQVEPWPSSAIPSVDIAAGTTVVQTIRDAERVVEILEKLPKESTFQAWDTEVADIDLSRQSPVAHGTVTCATFYCGPDVDFGNGPRVWVDTMDGEPGVLEVFRPILESEQHLKVWHNYGFDRHVLYREEIDCQGLGGDTMHMARVWSTARQRKGGYSLESLSADLLGDRKVPMKERFSVPKLKKDGTPGKERVLPSVRQLQRGADTRADWVDYATYDAEATWRLREHLEGLLRDKYWADGRTLYEFYREFIVPFAEVLTEMERNGIYVDTVDHLPNAERQAKRERIEAERFFVDWAASRCPDAVRMNVSSDAQKAHFLFAPTLRERPRRAGRSNAPSGPGRPRDDHSPTATTAASKDEWPRDRAFQVENFEGFIEPGKKRAKKNRDIVLEGQGLPAVKRTVAGWPAVSSDVLRDLAGEPTADPPRYGLAYDHFGGGDEGRQACLAIQSLHTISVIDTMLSNFILPLQAMADEESRVHCSLNLNTETGRLSARRPNLQNQPALDKDRYRIREAFQAQPGNSLVVADYGQLELRVLAHMARCQSMIDAFGSGGDFHSRTAMGMYDHVAAKVDAGEVLLEWDGADGEAPPKPLLKSVFGAERRRAKVLNFSIAYGKTAHGLAKDWDVTTKEAQATVDRWYADRPEVREWQQRVLELARQEGCTRTLMGRFRELEHINSRNRALRGRAERAAINTPIQGGAADIVMMAMIKLHRNERLRELGWKLLLQIHDEVILEGPSESAEEALALVVDDMEHPFEAPLLVDMIVDASIAQTWYEGK